MRKAQAVVIDGLFFLMICGFAASSLLWAGSMYGDKSFDAYRYIYMADYTSGALTVLSQFDYEYTVAGVPQPIKAAWLDELGAYMNGEFDEGNVRYTVMIGHWKTLCLQSPAPLLMTVFTEYKGAARGKQAEPLYFDCEGEKDTPDRDEDRSLMGALEDEGVLNVYKYPYYASPIQSKSCSTLLCVMDIKIYY